MALESVKAHFRCDRCGAKFTVTIDHAYTPPKGWTVFDFTEDMIRGGQSYEQEGVAGGIGSVDGDDHLCAACTRINDQDEDRSDQ